MPELEIKKDEASSDAAEKASAFFIQKEGKIFIKEGGRTMNKPEAKDKIVYPLEKAKNSEADMGDRPQIPGAEKATAANIDKIRDIIFGNQMQDYEKRFSRLEERMFKEMNVSKSETRENFDSLEKNLNKEIESLKNQLMNERNSRSETLRNIERGLEDIGRSLKDQVLAEENARSEAVRDVERQLRDMTRSVEKRIANIDDQLQRNSKDLNREISEQVQGLRGELRQKYEEIVSAVERVTEELRTDKTDRSALADVFMEMAMRITNK